MILANAILMLPDRLIPQGWVAFSQEGIILEIGQGAPPADPITIDVRNHYLSPGFVDLHVHGAKRRDAMEATPEAFAAIAEYHASGGTTSLALTTISALEEDIVAVLETMRNFTNTHAGAQVLGIHIEGPYFSPNKPGAHHPALLHPPTDLAELDRLLAYRDVITQMTLAPELPGALALIERLVESEIIASGGHSDCWAEEAEAARIHGMSQVTHAYNCMSSARRRGALREAGLLEYAMSEPEILCELIADGRHVSPTLMRALWQSKGESGISLVTDATAGAGLDDGEHYTLGAIDCVVKDGVGMLADGSAIAGSTSRMIDCVRNMVELADVSLVDAVRMATLNPARALRRERKVGILQPNYRADCAIFSTDFKIRQTWVSGQIVFENWDE